MPFNLLADVSFTVTLPRDREVTANADGEQGLGWTQNISPAS